MDKVIPSCLPTLYRPQGPVGILLSGLHLKTVTIEGEMSMDTNQVILDHPSDSSPAEMNSYNDVLLYSSAILSESCTCSKPADALLVPRAQRDWAGSQRQSDAILSRCPLQYFTKALKIS